jgi:hypothetical protein
MVVRRTGELLQADVDGETVALSIENGTCYSFNDSAARVWALTEQPRTVGEIRDALVAIYAVDWETCERGLHAILDDLVADRLVEISPPENQP